MTDLSGQLKALHDRASRLKEQMETEEATKTALILPFIAALGYDIFNPVEVVPEFTADIGEKKGEKVDYAIYKDGQPIIIIECKHWRQDLTLHDTQLQRYFNVTKARFGMLTNGLTYKFYTDLEEKNIMDKIPFLEFSLEKLKDSQLAEIEKFKKENFDVERIISTASALKYIKAAKDAVEKDLEDPSEEFVRLISNRIYTGRLTEKVLSQFKEYVKLAVSQSINDRVNARLQAALQKENEQQKALELIKEEPKIETTQAEMDAFNIVKAIAAEFVDPSRISFKDSQTVFSILLDDSIRKAVCRLYMNGQIPTILTFEAGKNEVRTKLESLNDIYKLRNHIGQTILSYLEK